MIPVTSVMPRLAVTAVSGWLLVLLLAATIRLTYRLAVPLPAVGTYLPPRRRLRLHYWFGYAIAALTLAHGWVPMTPSIVRHAHRSGLLLASLALLLVVVEVGLGLWLRGRTARLRIVLRRIHFWVMTVLVSLVVVHVALDSSLLGTFHAGPAGFQVAAPP